MVNKLIVNGEVKVDLTNDTVVPEKLLYGYSAHDASGSPIDGSLMIATGKVQIASDVKTNTTVEICSYSEIGFTPHTFILFLTSPVTTDKYIISAEYRAIDTKYSRILVYSNKGNPTAAFNTNNWTTSTEGYLYYDGTKIYIRVSTKYMLAAGQWNWIALG